MNKDYIVKLDEDGKCSTFESFEEYESLNEKSCKTDDEKYEYDDKHCDENYFVDECDECDESEESHESDECDKCQDYNQNKYQDHGQNQYNDMYCNCWTNKYSSKEDVCKQKREKKSSDTHKKNCQKREHDKCRKAYESGYDNGYDEGYKYGMKCGYEKGLTEGFKKGVEAGVARIYREMMLRARYMNRRCNRRFYR